jgi:hypothetical protein
LKHKVLFFRDQDFTRLNTRLRRHFGDETIRSPAVIRSSGAGAHLQITRAPNVATRMLGLDATGAKPPFGCCVTLNARPSAVTMWANMASL